MESSSTMNACEAYVSTTIMRQTALTGDEVFRA